MIMDNLNALNDIILELIVSDITKQSNLTLLNNKLLYKDFTLLDYNNMILYVCYFIRNNEKYCLKKDIKEFVEDSNNLTEIVNSIKLSIFNEIENINKILNKK
jgi:hypothetical protein